ncbi:MAG: hypothetical protein DWP98_14195 [Bacteroidetes bacterium]|nr:MAG: hypothetical protein DWP98_14195 [Bacteroidota bacterium]MBL1145355.1 SdpI family protein [Bacteroidota bacterium]MCB0801886.1 SdpI family protein [Flavobacteriales bacterium]NOG58153.1 SdpI family protein [Bacteroidota bacterium]
MNFDSTLFVLNGLCGIIFLILFFIVYRFPPKKINSFYGYRTARSMKNQELWDFAQTFSAIQFLKSAVILIFVSIIGLFTNLDHSIDVLIASLILAAAILYPIYKTENALKQIDNYENNHSNK